VDSVIALSRISARLALIPSEADRAEVLTFLKMPLSDGVRGHVDYCERLLAAIPASERARVIAFLSTTGEVVAP
jgi:hypothetical protein